MKQTAPYTLCNIIFLPSTSYQNTSILFPQLSTLYKEINSVIPRIYICSPNVYSEIYSDAYLEYSYSVFPISEKNELLLYTNNTNSMINTFETLPLSNNTIETLQQFSNNLNITVLSKLKNNNFYLNDFCSDNFKYFLSHLETFYSINLHEAIFISSADDELSVLKEQQLSAIAYKNPHLSNQELFHSSYLFEHVSDLNMENICMVYQRFYHLPVTILDTKHLILRELTVSDMKQLFTIYQEPSMTRFIPKEISLQELEKKHAAYIRNHYEFYEYGLWGVFLKDNDTLIGRCGVQQPSELPPDIKNLFIDTDGIILELSYMIDTHFQHKGYALEITRAILNYVCHTLECYNIISFISPENLPSIKLAEHLNMKPYKNFYHNGYNCTLYYLDFKKKYLSSREHVLHSFANNPDTKVYGKRYQSFQK